MIVVQQNPTHGTRIYRVHQKRRSIEKNHFLIFLHIMLILHYVISLFTLYDFEL